VICITNYTAAKTSKKGRGAQRKAIQLCIASKALIKDAKNSSITIQLNTKRLFKTTYVWD